MQQAVHQLSVFTRGKGLTDITDKVRAWVELQEMGDGLLTLFCRHTSASLLIQENADPSVQRDLERFFKKLVPEQGGYEHDTEGPDDMPAHIRTALTNTNLSIPLIDGALQLGTWQGIYVFEHRAHGHRREIALHLIGE